MWTLTRCVVVMAVCGAALGAAPGCAGKKQTQQGGVPASVAAAPESADATGQAEAAPGPKVWGAGARKTETANAPGAAATQAPIGPPARPPMEAAAPASTSAPSAQEAPIESVSATTPSNGAKKKKSGPRTDGRPDWWLDAPQSGDGRFSVSAEAMGDDVLSARRAAVDAGREALRRALGGADPADEKIISASVRPLPSKGVGAGGKRFVGYVLMSGAAG